MASDRYTSYQLVHCGDAAGVMQVGVVKWLDAGWELYGSPFVRSNTVYQAMVLRSDSLVMDQIAVIADEIIRAPNLVTAQAWARKIRTVASR